jgi:stearoyl-CoA desaturase (delta-9 desaturase)
MQTPARSVPAEPISWGRSLPFLLAHALPVLAFFVPFHWSYVVLALVSYYVRMLFLTIGYHRYFAHRSFQTSRPFAFVLAFLAQLSAQKGVLWWSSHHRHHHRASDQEDDAHSPTQRGLWWSHFGWVMAKKHEDTRTELVKDLARYPELRFLNKHWWLPPVIGLVGLFAVGGLPWVIWGGLISTIVLFHGTFTINSLSHVFGKRRYLTTDTSRNNWVLALITCGEGWHNNHHYHQNTANQGWFWWEVDTSYYLLRVLQGLGLVWKLKTPEAQTRDAHLKYTPEQKRLLAAPTGYGARKAGAPVRPAAPVPLQPAMSPSR